MAGPETGWGVATIVHVTSGCGAPSWLVDAFSGQGLREASMAKG
jgi:hypothetical protein